MLEKLISWLVLKQLSFRGCTNRTRFLPNKRAYKIILSNSIARSWQSHYLFDDIGFIFIFEKKDGKTKVFISQAITQVVPLYFPAVRKLWPIGVGVHT